MGERRNVGGNARALCVGVTGHRDLATRYRAHHDAIRGSLGVALIAIREFSAAVCPRSHTASLRLLSPLAEGADRLAARVAHAIGYRLLAPLPFRQAEYERDFDAASRTDFRRLIAWAKAEDGVIELSGSRADCDAGYRAVGEFVVTNSDVLVAVWDPRRPSLKGGTGEVIASALRQDRPVVWISPGIAGPPLLLAPTPIVSGLLPATRPLAQLKRLLRKQVVSKQILNP